MADKMPSEIIFFSWRGNTIKFCVPILQDSKSAAIRLRIIALYDLKQAIMTNSKLCTIYSPY